MKKLFKNIKEGELANAAYIGYKWHRYTDARSLCITISIGRLICKFDFGWIKKIPDNIL